MMTTEKIGDINKMFDIIDSTFFYIGIFPHYLGFLLLKDAIVLKLKNYSRHVTSEIYGAIAEKYNTTGSCVERNIRNVINSAFKNGALIKINELLKADVMDSTYCLTNCQLISLLTTYFYKLLFPSDDIKFGEIVY